MGIDTHGKLRRLHCLRLLAFPFFHIGNLPIRFDIEWNARRHDAVFKEDIHSRRYGKAKILKEFFHLLLLLRRHPHGES